jgi:MoaA/NifB/PqqE/SkfB family radical SAM enzyme
VVEMVRRDGEISEVELFRLIEETYLELSARHGWRILNCYHYSTKFNVCYGAPVFLGGREVWGKEGLFEELNRKLTRRGYTDITWDYFRELMRRIERQGIIWVNWFIAPNGEVEPHDITIMKPTFLKHS